jgi:tetratricopeptide (TPR) repeat protein
MLSIGNLMKGWSDMSEVTMDKFHLIHTLIESKKFLKALNLLLDPISGRIRSDYSKNRNHAWYCVGDIEFKKRNFLVASRAFKNAYSKEKADVSCLIAIGNCYDQLMRPKLAERYFRKALNLAPRGKYYRFAVYNLANSVLDQKRYSEAKILYNKINRKNDFVGIAARKNLALISKIVSRQQ